MRKLIPVTILTLSALVISNSPGALEDNALYQWQSKDGTPTYSPEPPPAGVDYVVVDADLNPLPVQPPRQPQTQEATAAGIPAAPAAAALPAAPTKKVPDWKPIRYADDPTARASGNNNAKIARSQASSTPEIATVAVTEQSSACKLLKRERQILEGFFAEAKTAAEMDQAIVSLQKKTEAYRRQCS